MTDFSFKLLQNTPVQVPFNSKVSPVVVSLNVARELALFFLRNTVKFVSLVPLLRVKESVKYQEKGKDDSSYIRGTLTPPPR